VGYPELLRALEEEVRAQARALRESAQADRERVLEEARRAGAAARERALAEARDAVANRRARREARAARDLDLRLLAEKHRLLDGLAAAARDRLAERAGPDLTARLLDEALAEAGPGPIAAVVDPGEEEAARSHLARSHPEVAARAVVRAAPARRGGAAVEVGDRVVLDNSLPARLAKAWPALRGELALLLFGGDDGAL